MTTGTDFERSVVELAKTLGYMVMHTRPVKANGKWVTPIQGDKGFPDLVLVGRRQVLFRELKTGRGRLTIEQAQWGHALQAAGADWAVWRDWDWRNIQKQLENLAEN